MSAFAPAPPRLPFQALSSTGEIHKAEDSKACGLVWLCSTLVLSCLFRWEETRKNGVKWQQLEHKGPCFTPAYEPLPDGVHFFYDGEGWGEGEKGGVLPRLGCLGALG